MAENTLLSARPSEPGTNGQLGNMGSRGLPPPKIGYSYNEQPVWSYGLMLLSWLKRRRLAGSLGRASDV